MTDDEFKEKWVSILKPISVILVREFEKDLKELIDTEYQKRYDEGRDIGYDLGYETGYYVKG